MNDDPIDRARSLVPLLRGHAARVDADAVFPEDALAAMRANGLLGLLVPARYGGLDGDLGDLVEVARVLAGGCLSTALIWAMHCQQVDTLVRHAGPELAAEVLPRIARGETYLGSVTTEPGTGGNLLAAHAAVEGTGQLGIDRQAPIVTGGAQADAFLITMRAATDAAEQQVSLVYADRAQLDVTPAASGWDPMGMRGTHSVGLHLTGKVPAHQLVGRPGHFRDIAVDSMIVAGHLGWSACWLGAAAAAVRDFVGLPRSPGTRALDPRNDLVTTRLARIRMDLELVSAYLHRVRDEVCAARRGGEPLDTPAIQIHLNTLKVVASELTFRGVDNLMRLAGLGGGYLRDAPVPIERHFRDLRSAALNFHNDRLLTATGALSILDRSLRLA